MPQYLSALFLDKHFWTNTGKSFFILFHVYIYCKIYKFYDRTIQQGFRHTAFHANLVIDRCNVLALVIILCFPCRSSVPITKQANKNLILKATAEAEKSVSSAMDSVLKEEKLYSAKGKSSYFRIKGLLC